MLGRVRWLAPGVVLHAARAFARDPVRVGAAQAGVLDRLMRVHRQVPARGLLYHLQVVAGHELPVVPLAPQRAAARIAAVNLAVIADVTGLELVHAQPRIQVQRGAQLVFVVLDGAAGFVVAEQVHALLQAVGRERLDIEVRRGTGEVEVVTVANPVAIPAGIPAFHQHAAEAMRSSEVDHLLRFRGGGRVLRAARPALVDQVHRPPHAQVLGRLYPAHIAQRIGFIEVEDQGRFDQPAGTGGDLQRAPRRGKGQGAAHLPTLGRGRKLRAQALALGAAQPHAGVVNQRRLMDRHVQAIAAAQGHRRIHQRHLTQRRALVQVFVVDRLAGGNPPGGRFRRNGELGQLVIDDRLVKVRLLGEHVAEAQAIVVDAEHHIQPAPAAGGLGQLHGQLVEVVAGDPAFAPGLFPAVIDAAPLLAEYGEITVQAAVAQGEAELRILHHGLAETLDAVAGGAAVQYQAGLEHLARRFDTDDLRRGLRQRGHCQQRQAEHEREHGPYSSG
ncbi:hypothetical protein G6F57_012721 [Rhizopus arrhizus]|nr:hypothetical protein G6F57_012721 [Rhizopus arrhizus]